LAPVGFAVIILVAQILTAYKQKAQDLVEYIHIRISKKF
jgi:hypothetical protein